MTPDGTHTFTHAITSSGRKRQYSYYGDWMTSVSDENGTELVHNSYDQNGWLTEQEFSDGSKYSYSYEADPGTNYAHYVTVTMPGGGQQRIDVSGSVPEFVKHPPMQGSQQSGFTRSN